MKATGIILCGGKGRRFGGDKISVAVGGRPVTERVIERLREVSDQILLVTTGDRATLPMTGDAETVVDEYPGKGPLAGIYTGVAGARYSRAIVVGCDMPFLNTGLLRHMLGLCEGFDAVIPRLESGFVEPLHAVYSRTCLPVLKARLEAGHLAINRLLGELHIRYIERAEYLPLDPRGLSFFNINYPEDLVKANEIASEIERATE